MTLPVNRYPSLSRRSRRFGRRSAARSGRRERAALSRAKRVPGGLPREGQGGRARPPSRASTDGGGHPSVGHALKEASSVRLTAHYRTGATIPKVPLLDRLTIRVATPQDVT